MLVIEVMRVQLHGVSIWCAEDVLQRPSGSGRQHVNGSVELI